MGKVCNPLKPTDLESGISSLSRRERERRAARAETVISWSHQSRFRYHIDLVGARGSANVAPRPSTSRPRNGNTRIRAIFLFRRNSRNWIKHGLLSPEENGARFYNKYPSHGAEPRLPRPALAFFNEGDDSRDKTDGNTKTTVILCTKIPFTNSNNPKTLLVSYF